MATLSSGTRLGVYEILSALGAGGMGEVYRARDTKLGREVAIKVLPELFVSDRERVARFEREAQLLASLNHSHIAGIYGLEESSGTHFLILELVDGETLAARIARGPLPIPEALGIARQIAEALQAAHDKGIIHRDLKPANVALTADGQVKVLDFGLAKAMGREGAAEAANSPTLTLGATAAGMILGTAAYMSPEQAKGRAADKRSDVWGFGCVLYEMLTGKRAFEGEDVSDTLANVLKSEPDWSALPADTPSSIRALIKRAIEKDRTRRIADISTALFLIDEQERATPTPAATGAAAPPVRAWTRLLPWAVAGTLAVALISLLLLWSPWTPRVSTPLRLSADLGVDASLWASNSGSAVILSPDGRTLAFVAQTRDASAHLYVRRLDQLQPTALSGTDDATSPFFSPDGQWIAFFAGGKLKKVSVTGGAAVTICDVPNGRGGDWGEDGTIVYSPAPAPGNALWRVSASGGSPEPFSTLEGKEVTHRFPHVLPGGKGVLFMANDTTGGYDNASLVVQALPSGTRKVVVRGGYYGRYVRSGHLMYVHEGTVFAAPFDLDRLEVSGPAVPVIDGLPYSGGGGGAQYSVSSEGTLVYLLGTGPFGAAVPLHWLDRQSKATPLRTTPANWSNPMFAPDGARLAMDIHDGTQTDIWVYDWARDTPTRMTFGLLSDMKPVWTPDGRRIVFASAAVNAPALNLVWQPADGTGDAQRLMPPSPNLQVPSSWHPSGRFLLYEENRGSTGFDLMILPLEGDATAGWKPGQPTVFLATRFTEQEGVFSPDGRWIAYESNETGQNEVYVRPYPGPGGKWQISAGGGQAAAWSGTRNELLYYAASRQVMASTYTVDRESFRADRPRPWADARIMNRARNVPARPYAVHPDGERLAVAAVTETATRADKVVVVFNFFDELRRLAPPK